MISSLYNQFRGLNLKGDAKAIPISDAVSASNVWTQRGSVLPRLPKEVLTQRFDSVASVGIKDFFPVTVNQLQVVVMSLDGIFYYREPVPTTSNSGALVQDSDGSTLLTGLEA